MGAQKMDKLQNSFTGKNVEYYDKYFLPIEKVKNECNYAMSICLPYLSSYNKLIDVGCGTGVHAQLLSRRFKKVYGIDISKDMIRYAKINHSAVNLHFFCFDITRQKNCEVNNGDLVISLSHVIGYQLDNISVKNYLLGINRVLKNGGIFLFNFYYQPALYLNSLKPRLVRIDGEEEVITRISNASLNSDENCLDLDYYYIIENKLSVLYSYEVHEKMRFFSLLEMEYFLYENGFKILKTFKYNTTEKLSSTTWNGGILAKKMLQK